MKVPFGWPQKWREQFKDKACIQCNRPYGSHSMQEFEDCMDKTISPYGRTWKEVLNDSGGRLALANTRDGVASNACSFCQRAFGEHSDEEFTAFRGRLRRRVEGIQKARAPRPE